MTNLKQEEAFEEFWGLGPMAGESAAGPMMERTNLTCLECPHHYHTMGTACEVPWCECWWEVL
jgi:hypothetical protein